MSSPRGRSDLLRYAAQVALGRPRDPALLVRRDPSATESGALLCANGFHPYAFLHWLFRVPRRSRLPLSTFITFLGEMSSLAIRRRFPSRAIFRSTGTSAR